MWEKALDNLGDIGDFIADAAGKAGSLGIWGILLVLRAAVLGALVMTGLAFPMTQHLLDPRIVHFTNPTLRDVNGTNPHDVRNRVPMLRFTQGGIWHNDRHLVYPPCGR